MRERDPCYEKQKTKYRFTLGTDWGGGGGILKLLSQSIKGKQKCQDYVKNNKGQGRAQHETNSACQKGKLNKGIHVSKTYMCEHIVLLDTVNCSIQYFS
jgi:hypothetical protein